MVFNCYSYDNIPICLDLCLVFTVIKQWGNLKIKVRSLNRAKIMFKDLILTKLGNEYTYVFKQWIVLFRKLFMFAHTVRCSYKTTSFEKEQSIAYIYILKTFPTLHFNFF